MRLQDVMVEVCTRQTKPIRQQRMIPLLRRLMACPGRVVPAAELADAIGIPSTWLHETRRRRVREVVEFARDHGREVCANSDGYWLARSPEEFGRYLYARKRGAKFTFVAVRKMSEAATDRHMGQGKLFETRPLAF